MSISKQPSPKILSVGALNRCIRQLLEQQIGQVWVEGEISNLSQPSYNEHIYFSLKDQHASVRCAFFRGYNQFSEIKLQNGMQILAKANVSLYETKGEYQLIIQKLEVAGAGLLRWQFEQLKTKLSAEGLFDNQFKQTLPKSPHTIGIVTSPSGAALRDILSVLKRRSSATEIIIYPCPVQGGQAAQQIITALKTANRRNECQLLILARGGGSLEDLSCFNDENLARTIFNSQLPIITGIGHEIDFTIADFVADVRAPTPSAAAEIISHDQTIWLNEAMRLQKKLIISIQQYLNRLTKDLHGLNKRLRHPDHLLREYHQSLDFIEQKLIAVIWQIYHRYEQNLTLLLTKLKQQDSLSKIERHYEKLMAIQKHLYHYIKFTLNQREQTLQKLLKTLNAISPLSVLERGYSIVRNKQAHTIIRSAHQVCTGEKILITLHEGELVCTVNDLLIE